jgi:hypothetical protein
MLAYINTVPHTKKDSSQIRQKITRKIRSNIRPGPVTSEPRDRVIKKLVWILKGDQKFDMYITGLSKSWYEYYRATKKLVWILQGDQNVVMNITGWSKMNKNKGRQRTPVMWCSFSSFNTRRATCKMLHVTSINHFLCFGQNAKSCLFFYSTDDCNYCDLL